MQPHQGEHLEERGHEGCVLQRDRGPLVQGPDGVWKNSESFGVADLDALIVVAQQATRWIAEGRTADPHGKPPALAPGASFIPDRAVRSFQEFLSQLGHRFFEIFRWNRQAVLWPQHRQFACQRRGDRGCVEIKALRHERHESPLPQGGHPPAHSVRGLMRYKYLTEADRHGVLDQLIHNAHALKMGY